MEEMEDQMQRKMNPSRTNYIKMILFYLQFLEEKSNILKFDMWAI